MLSKPGLKEPAFACAVRAVLEWSEINKCSKKNDKKFQSLTMFKTKEWRAFSSMVKKELHCLFRGASLWGINQKLMHIKENLQNIQNDICKICKFEKLQSCQTLKCLVKDVFPNQNTTQPRVV